MPARIVFDYPNGQTRHAVARLLSLLIGSLLVGIGLLATVVVIPTGFITVGDVLTTLSHDPEPVFSPDFPLRECEAAFAASTIVAIAGIRYGRRIVRGRRRAVLFLRRFGFRDSMQAVTFAVMHTIGSSWRLVTLDDAAIAPVGVDSVSRLTIGLGERIARLAGAAGKAILTSFQWTVSAMWLVVALQLLLAPNWRRVLVDGTFEPYVKIFAMVMEHHVPVRYFGPTLPGVFAIAITAFALSFVGLGVMFVVLLLMFPFFGFVIMATSSAEALHRAEAAKTRAINHVGEVSVAAAAVSQQGQQTFAPRLIVLRVATAAWQETVSALAGVTSASVIDVSEPTDNLVWELRELERRCPGRWIMIGEHARVVRWTEADAAPPDADSLEARFAACLGSRELLAYTTDRRGMRRFAHALCGMLLNVDGP